MKKRCSRNSCIIVASLLFCTDDLWPESERKENSKEPSWVQSEREQFKGQRDKDKDGQLNKVIQIYVVKSYGLLISVDVTKQASVGALVNYDLV